MFRFGSGFWVRGSGFTVLGSGGRFCVRGGSRCLQELPPADGFVGVFVAWGPASRVPRGVRGCPQIHRVARLAGVRCVQESRLSPVFGEPLAGDWSRRTQLERAASGAPAHVAEGFGRFSPADFARFLVLARSSLMESQNHLRDAVDKGYITEETRLEHDALAEAALQEVTGLMEYLQSPEALRNARRARERRIASRPERRTNEHQPRSPEPRRPRTNEPRTKNRT